MRHPRRRGRRPAARQPKQRRRVVLPPRPAPPKVRVYLGPPAAVAGIPCTRGTVVVWVDGRWHLRDPGTGTYHRTYARPPRALKDRINEALRKGRTHG